MGNWELVYRHHFAIKELGITYCIRVGSLSKVALFYEMGINIMSDRLTIISRSGRVLRCQLLAGIVGEPALQKSRSLDRT